MSNPAADTLTPDLLSYLDGQADDATVERLDAAMRSDPALRRRFAMLCVEAREFAELLGKATGAEAIIEDAPPTLRITPPTKPRRRRYVAASWMAAAVVFAAMGLGLWSYLGHGRVAPGGSDGVQTGGAVSGVIVDATDAEWTSDPLDDGGEVRADRRLALASGTVGVEMLGGASVTLTGPVSVSVIDGSACFLEHGRIDVDLGDSGGSFRVVTPRFTATDLGTRFSVEYTASDVSHVRVAQGAVELRLRPSPTGETPEPIKLIAGTTAAIPPDASSVADVSIMRRIDLAYVVGGTDGVTRPDKPMAIDTYNGRPTEGSIEAVSAKAAGPIAAEHPLIDSVFAIDTRDGTFPVSMSGVRVAGLPAVTGGAWEHVRFGPAHRFASTVHGGIDYMGPDHSIIGMHTSRGVTFDLGAMRQAGDGLIPKRFVAGCGMAANSPNGVADFFVAVDGVIVYERRGVKAADPVAPIDVTLGPDAKLLTLIATESNGSISSDWSFYADPIVELTAPSAPITPNPADAPASDVPTP